MWLKRPLCSAILSQFVKQTQAAWHLLLPSNTSRMLRFSIQLAQTHGFASSLLERHITRILVDVMLEMEY
jgi:hypothetical protein